MVRPVASLCELADKDFDVHIVGGQGWMEKSGKTVEFARRGNRFMLPVTLRTDQNENFKELCPLEGQAKDIDIRGGVEQSSHRSGAMHEKLRRPQHRRR